MTAAPPARRSACGVQRTGGEAHRAGLHARGTGGGPGLGAAEQATRGTACAGAVPSGHAPAGPRWRSAVGNALYDASGRRTRCRGPTRRERTTRRTVSYKASGPDASGMYDASYSVVQGVVQHRHRTTQYDTVRHGTTQYDTVRHSTTQYDTVRHGTSHTDIYICRHINTCKWKKKQIGQNGAKWVQMRFHFGQNSPKGETSNIGTSRLQHADNVYN